MSLRLWWKTKKYTVVAVRVAHYRPTVRIDAGAFPFRFVCHVIGTGPKSAIAEAKLQEGPTSKKILAQYECRRGVTRHEFEVLTADLPPGDYELEAWHEKLKTKSAKVTIKGDESATVDFSFSAPSR